MLDGEHDRPVEIDHRKMAMAAAMSAGKALMAKDYGEPREGFLFLFF